MAERKTAPTAEEKEAAQPKPPKDQSNGVTRPKAGTTTGRVWEIADAISAEKGEPAARKEVLEEFLKEDGNPSTGATQYGRWRKYHGLAQETGKPGRPKKETAETAPEPAQDAGDEPPAVEDTEETGEEV